jgi:hypothetical protein
MHALPCLPAAARKITIKGIASCAVSPTTTYGRLLGAFIPEAKGSPASVGGYTCCVVGLSCMQRTGAWQFSESRAGCKALAAVHGASTELAPECLAVLLSGLYDMDGPAEPTPRCKKGFFRTQGGCYLYDRLCLSGHNLLSHTLLALSNWSAQINHRKNHQLRQDDDTSRRCTPCLRCPVAMVLGESV